MKDNSDQTVVESSNKPTNLLSNQWLKNKRIEEAAQIYKSLKMSETIDCPDKTCTLHFQYKDSCLVYLETNVSNCNIPCEYTGCNFKFSSGHCRVWTCVDRLSTSTTSTSTTAWTTTTLDSTTTSDTTTSMVTTDLPIPTTTTESPSNSTFHWTVFSFVINGLLFGLVLFLLVIYIRSCLRLRRFERDERRDERNENFQMRRFNRRHFERRRRHRSESEELRPMVSSNSPESQAPAPVSSATTETANITATTLEEVAKPKKRFPFWFNLKSKNGSERASKAAEPPIIKPNPVIPPRPDYENLGAIPRVKQTTNKPEELKEPTSNLPSSNPPSSNLPSSNPPSSNVAATFHISQAIAVSNTISSKSIPIENKPVFVLANSSDYSFDESSPLLTQIPISHSYETINPQHRNPIIARSISPIAHSLSSDSSLYSTFGRQTFEEHRLQRAQEIKNIAENQFMVMKKIEDYNKLSSAIEQGKQLKETLEKQAEALQRQNLMRNASIYALPQPSEIYMARRNTFEDQSQQLLQEAIQTQRMIQARNDELQLMQIQSQAVINQSQLQAQGRQYGDFPSNLVIEDSSVQTNPFK